MFDDIAAMQALDFICGNTSRNSDSFLTRYAPGKDGKPTLTGFTLIDNDFSFGTNIPKPTAMTDKLPALYAMGVVSQEMLDKLRDPNTLQEIEAGMKRNCLSQEALEKGQPPLKPASQEQKKESPFAPCVKVEGFGKNLLENKHLAELRKQAERDFLEQMKSAMLEAPATENVMDAKTMLAHLRENGSALYNRLDAADPWYHGTSKRKTCSRDGAGYLFLSSA